MTTVNEPVWRTALSGAQILFVAFGATVLVPLLTGLNPAWPAWRRVSAP